MLSLLCIVIVISVYTVTSAAYLGEPAFVTCLLEKGKYKEAQELARVTPDLGGIITYSGFFTINKKCESNMHFWFILAQNRSWTEAPLVLWQQGGPGISSFFGLFMELGPFQYFNESGLTPRQYPWSMENNLLIIDNPVGVGYSFTGKECYPDDEAENAEDWYKALIQFYQLFPELQDNPFILTGESYAGHFIPLFGHTIHKNNPTADIKVNLTGMFILGAWSDPETLIDYGTHYYQLGLIDDRQRDIYYKYQELCIEYIRLEQWENALYNGNMLMNDLFTTFVGYVNIYNLLPGTGFEEQSWDVFLQTDDVRKQLHVGDLIFNSFNEVVYDIFLINKYKSVKSYVEELLEHYPIVFASGQLDLICPYPGEVKFLRSMIWSGSATYLTANRSIWCLEEEQVGYFKGDDRLYDILVRGAGHYIPQDQAAAAYVLINSVTSGFPSQPLHALQQC